MSGGVLQAVRAAWAGHDWARCVEQAEPFVRDGGRGRPPGEQAEVLDLYADASWWLGRLDACIEARERAYRIYDDLGEARRAGQCAVWLYEHHCFRASPAVASGWLGRARRALGAEEPCPEVGALLLREAEVAHGSGDLERAAERAEGGLELGRALRSPDLEAEALQCLGRIRIDEGRPSEGLALLDEAMLFAVEGRLSPYSTGKVYCSLISACEALSDHRRAAEWTAATTRWAEQHPHAVFPGLCRVHHAVALQWRGDLAGAEREAARACDELATINLPNAAAAWAEIGDIRRRLGDLAGAASAFARADELAAQPRAGLALLRLAEGDLEAATTIVDEALEAAGWDRLARAKALPAVAQIAIAAGDADTATRAVDELQATAATFDSAGLRAAALSARGRLELAMDDPGAPSTLRAAAAAWTDLAVPYEAATAKTLLGEAHRRRGEAAAAARAFADAAGLFDELGVQVEGRRLDPAPGPAPLPEGLTEREAEVLRLVAAGHTNKEIAATLFLSDKTVARHLSNIFTKIGVSTRAGATAFAFERGVVRSS